MNEDYVSFETAKLLKEKGFDEVCIGFYTPQKELHFTLLEETNSMWLDDSISAPTLQMAMKWIRKKYNAYPVPYALSLGWAFDIFDLTKTDITGSKKIYSMDAPLKSDCFDSYENAAEAAINYYLDNFA